MTPTITSFAEWLRSIFLGMKFWFTVMPWEKGVRVRLGKNTALKEPGVHLRIPWADEVVIVNTRLRVTASSSMTVTSSDGKAVTTAVLVGFRIVAPLDAMMAFKDPEVTCMAIVQTAVTKYVARHGAAEIKMDALEAEALKHLEQFSKGIEFAFVQVTEFAIVRTYRILQDSWKPALPYAGQDKTVF